VKFILVFSTFILFGFSSGEDLTTTDGKLYKNLKITKEEPATIKILHDDGISLIQKSVLPADFLKAHEMSAAPLDSAITETNDSKSILSKFIAQFPTISTKDGRTYPSNQVASIEPSGLKIISSSGIVRVKFIDLPERYKEALKYDPLKSAEYERSLEKARLASAESIQQESNAASVIDTLASHVRLEMVQNYGKGWICFASKVATVEQDVVSSRRVSPLTGTVTTEVRRIESVEEVADLGKFVVFGLSIYGALPAHLQESRRWSGKIFTFGKCELTNTNGVKQTLMAAHLDRNAAIKLVAANGIGKFYSAEGEPIRIDSGSGVFAASGTGFGITSDGYIATAAHVVEGASEIRVVLNQKHELASLVALDKKNDVAILKISKPTKFIQIEPTSGLLLGQDLFTIGFPLIDKLGVEPKFTKGNVSGLEGGSLKAEDENNDSAFQISVPVQPGNSGGPVCSKDGKVIGIVRSTLVRAQNVNFASRSDVLIDLAKTVADLKLAVPVGFTAPEKAVLEATYLISVTGKE
jgi:S1-C subfamily serine protease